MNDFGILSITILGKDSAQRGVDFVLAAYFVETVLSVALGFQLLEDLFLGLS